MLPKIHMRGAYASHKYGKNKLSDDLLKIWAGATSRADIPKHHFPAQHGRITGPGVEFIKDSSEYLRIKLKKIVKLQQLQEHISSSKTKKKYSVRQQNKLKQLIDIVIVKLGYAGGRVDHSILDVRSHLAPKGIVNYEMITGKIPPPPELWACNFAIGKEFLGGVFRNMCKLKTLNALLKTIYKNSNIKPTRKFSIIKPKSWIDELKSSHVFVNLDRRGTIHDQASVLATGKSAFFEAMTEGIRDTRRFWKEEVIEKVAQEVGKEKVNKTTELLANWQPLDKNLLQGPLWEKIGEKSFDIGVANKFKDPNSKQFRKDGGPFSDFVMYTLTPFIPYEYSKKKGVIKILRQKTSKFFRKTLKE